MEQQQALSAFVLLWICLWIAVWIFCVWIGRNMALRRHRSGWFGGILGGLLGVFAFLILWGLGPKERRP